MAERILARRRLLPFVKRVNPKYDAGWVHEDICERLERFSDAVAAGLSPRLMLLMPPRHGKSELASRSFPPWHLGRHPDHEFIACSYNIDLARDFSKKVQRILDDPQYHGVFDARLDPNDRSAESWGVTNPHNSQHGAYVAAGTGGGITGKGAHVLVIDDPIKSAEEADSAGTRESLWQWYLSTAYSRLAPGGGVLVIQCMTGDTPVLMSDGREQRLDTLTSGSEIATFENGALATSAVRAIKSNGRDRVFKITTSSGRMVRANGRHPFLATVDGELKWVRTRSLTTAHKIVALPGSGGSGAALGALPQDVKLRPSAEGCALRTTTNKNGLTGADRLASTPSRGAKLTSNTGTESQPPSTTSSWPSSAGYALSAPSRQAESNRIIGGTNSPSTTATTAARFADCCATTATQESDILELSPRHLPRPGTSSFTLDGIVSVEPDGVEEVFDVQVDRTENFIANGLVSHNTWWHDDDLAGRLQEAMRGAGVEDADVDQFEVVKYAALAESDEWRDNTTKEIVRVDHNDPFIDDPDDSCVQAHLRAAAHGVDTTNLTYLRSKGEPLHAARYDLAKLRRIRAQNNGGRWWSALYQQNPVPADGDYFTKDQFKRQALPQLRKCRVYCAWDFAISEKKHNDYTVGTVGLQDENDTIHVAEVVRFKSGNAFFIVEAILNMAERWYSPSLVLGFEDGQIFRAIQALLKKRMMERKMYPAIEVLHPITDKAARARPLQGRMQQGMVSFNATGDWYDVVRQEMLRFPAGAHDDCVDSLAWLTQLVLGKNPPQAERPKAVKSWRDKLAGMDRTSLSHMAA